MAGFQAGLSKGSLSTKLVFEDQFGKLDFQKGQLDDKLMGCPTNSLIVAFQRPACQHAGLTSWPLKGLLVDKLASRKLIGKLPFLERPACWPTHLWKPIQHCDTLFKTWTKTEWPRSRLSILFKLHHHLNLAHNHITFNRWSTFWARRRILNKVVQQGGHSRQTHGRMFFDAWKTVGGQPVQGSLVL